MQRAKTMPADRPVLARLTFPPISMLKGERWLIGSHILVALLALLPGVLMGPFQTFSRSPGFVEMFPDWEIPIFSFYYQSLTVHGVMNALFFTVLFIVGHAYFVTQRSLQRPLWKPGLAWFAFAVMIIGLLSTGYAIMLEGRSSVLYTFYTPLTAQPWFYLGLTLLIVGTWAAATNLFMTYVSWKRDNPDKRCPLAVFGVLSNFLMWCFATTSIALLMFSMLIPASFGWIEKTDPQLARILFWFFGHPLVYFWLFPAYISWYTMLPAQAGGRLFSQLLGRVAFLMLAIFSLPVGVHHLLADPGISQVAKFVHTVLTFVVIVPSLLTAFNIGAALERAGRRHGATGRLDWLWKQNWKNPVVTAQIGGLFMFIFGGFSGMIHASFTLNIALHNTSWVPAHFHMTLASAVMLTYIGMLYWLVPMLRGRVLWNRTMALVQVATWVGGMILFGHGMGAAGIGGVIRRTDLANAPYFGDGASVAFQKASVWLNTTAVGGVLLLISIILLYTNLVGTLFFSRKPLEENQVPISTEGDARLPLWLENWWMWLGVMIILAAMAWGPLLVDESLLFNAPITGPTGLPMR
jgi:cytochrome c oxidase subunit I